ncbi:hypothetical protein [Acidilobus sp. 7A]|uniref:hypothetical protein n=1 Tax=Acidilobus sp. 7A TaxID=1577685 RepID=UPI0013147924|nr:hypothetical protein [Acidilobus sp. 7A]
MSPTYEAEFPSLRSRHYLNWAAVGVPPLRAVGAVRSVLDAVESSPEAASSPEAVGAAKEEARAQLAPSWAAALSRWSSRAPAPPQRCRRPLTPYPSRGGTTQ